MKLKRDIYSKFKSNFKYANAGEEVKLVGVIIVENQYGVKFSVDADDILQEGESIINEERTINKVPAKKPTKSIQNNNQTLF